MSTRGKTLLIIVATLILGVVIGVLSSGALRQQKEKTYLGKAPDKRFRQVMERIIQPSDEQRQELHNILDKRFEEMANLRETFQKQVFDFYDSLRTDLAAVLTEEQFRRLEQRLAKGPESYMERRLTRLTAELGLSRKQRKRIRRIIRQTLPPPQPGNLEVPPHAPPDMLHDRFVRMQEEIERILTPEQRERYQRMRLERRGRQMGAPRFRGRERAHPAPPR